MTQLIFSPAWFALTDILIFGLSAVVTFLIATRAFKTYAFSSEARHKYFSAAFLVLSVAFITYAATQFFSLYNLFEKHGLGISTYTFGIVSSSQMLTGLGMLAFRVLLIVGLLTILHVIEGNANKKQILLTYLFGGIIVLLSIKHYFAFYVVSFILAGLITYRFYVNYLNRPDGKTASLAAGFFLITLGQAGLVFAPLETVYTLASLVQLLGFTLLLATYIQLVK